MSADRPPRRARDAGAAPWQREQRLHRGDLTEVWRVRTGDGRTLALKEARADKRHDRGVAALIRAEYGWLCELDHRHVVGGARLEERDGSPLLLTEYCAGGDLVPLLGAPAERWVRAAYAIATALGYLHGRGIVHRDIKPRNVLLRANDEPVISDFALAARAGHAVPWGGGTAGYRPAGMGTSGIAEPGLDWYAFAVMLHELATGRPPSPTAGAGPLDAHGAVDRGAWHVLERWHAHALGCSGAALGSLSLPTDVLESMQTLCAA